MNSYNEQRWQDNYLQAKTFFETHGHFPSQKEDRRLYVWARQWWLGGGAGHYPDKARLLSDIGFACQTIKDYHDSLWLKNYHEAEAFYKKHGHFPTMKENSKLRSWVRAWWHCSARHNPQKAEMLRAIGYCYQSVEEHSDMLWYECYDKAKAFFQSNGRFPKKGEGGSLRNWATRWWRKSAADNPDKAYLLTSIGFTYQSVDEINEQKWTANYGAVLSFFRQHGHFPTRAEDMKLRLWADGWWRGTYLKNPQLHEKKAQLLKDAGFRYRGMD